MAKLSKKIKVEREQLVSYISYSMSQWFIQKLFSKTDKALMIFAAIISAADFYVNKSCYMIGTVM